MNTVPNIGPFLRKNSQEGASVRAGQKMPESYWVVGGEYTDTSFTKVAGNGEEERVGPFTSYAEARRQWAARSMAQVDNALVRYRIDKRGATQYWVVGGEYTDTSFRTIAMGGAERRVGPFPSYEEARKQWAALSMAGVDNCLLRYRIDQM
ncbi:MAG: DUF4170 domain-containing protein [Candidatus Eiseniibacteriota bacterium]